MGKVIMSGIVPQLEAPYISPLPSGYTELAYIESTGTQRIDTGVGFQESNTTYEIETTALVTDTSGSSYSGWNGGGIFGNQSGAWTDGSTNANMPSANKTKIRLYIGTRAEGTTLELEQAGVQETLSRANTAIGTYATGKSYPIFAYSSNVGAVGGYIKMRVYGRFSIRVNGQLTRDFIPCINESGEVGLYDLVEQRFYGNAGTGEFTGSEVA